MNYKISFQVNPVHTVPIRHVKFVEILDGRIFIITERETLEYQVSEVFKLILDSAGI